jgi:uncharacterized membrane protein
MELRIAPLVFGILILALVDTPWLLLQKMVIKDPFYSGPHAGLNIPAALVVYVALSYILLQQGSVQDAFFIGMATYAVYDFTILALFKNFTLAAALADTIWGGVLMATSYYLLQKLKVL